MSLPLVVRANFVSQVSSLRSQVSGLRFDRREGEGKYSSDDFESSDELYVSNKHLGQVN